MGNVQIAVWRICILMLGYKGYKEIKRKKSLEKREDEWLKNLILLFKRKFFKKATHAFHERPIKTDF